MTVRHRIDDFAAALDSVQDRGPLVDGALDDSALDDELRALLAVAGRFEIVPLGAPAPFRDQLRRRLLDEARSGPARARRARAAEWLMSWRGRRTTIAVAGCAAIVLLLAALAVATGRSVPGDRLYGAKRATESARLDLTGGDAARARTDMGLARTRLRELRVLVARGNADRAMTLLDDMDAETRAAAALSHTDAARADLRAFADLQYAGLAALVPALDPAVAARAQSSLALLDTIRSGAVVGYADPSPGAVPVLPREPGQPGAPPPVSTQSAAAGIAPAVPPPSLSGSAPAASAGLPAADPAGATTIQPGAPLPAVAPAAPPTGGPAPLPTAPGGPPPLPTASGGPTPLPAVGSAPLPSVSSVPQPSASPAPVPTTGASPLPTVSPAPVPSVSASPLPTVSPAPVPSVSATPLPTGTASALPPAPLPTAPLPTPVLSATSVLSTSLPPLP